jgi:putative membrane protein
MSGVEDTKHEVDPRTLQALERTLLAWLRTGLALIGFGFVIARLGVFLRLHDPGENVLFGAGVMGALFGILGIAAEVLAIARYSALLVVMHARK